MSSNIIAMNASAPAPSVFQGLFSKFGIVMILILDYVLTRLLLPLDKGWRF